MCPQPQRRAPDQRGQMYTLEQWGTLLLSSQRSSIAKHFYGLTLEPAVVPSGEGEAWSEGDGKSCAQLELWRRKKNGLAAIARKIGMGNCSPGLPSLVLGGIIQQSVKTWVRLQSSPAYMPTWRCARSPGHLSRVVLEFSCCGSYILDTLPLQGITPTVCLECSSPRLTPSWLTLLLQVCSNLSFLMRPTLHKTVQFQ